MNVSLAVLVKVSVTERLRWSAVSDEADDGFDPSLPSPLKVSPLRTTLVSDVREAV